MNCEVGGTGLHIGVDDNADGYLTVEEFDQTRYVCHGQVGANGTTTTSMLSAVEKLSKSSGCPAGGRVMLYGLDNGDNGGIPANGLLEAGEIDDQTTYCSTQRIGLVDDVVPGENGSFPRSYQGMKLIVGDTMFYSANDGIHGFELWAYGLTTDKAWMVSDIRSGENGSFPGYWLGIVHEEIIYFDAWTDTHGRELWAHNTVTGSTWIVANLQLDNPFPSGSNPGDDIEIMYGDFLYFSAFTHQYATELWAYDTVSHMTWLVKDIHMGSSSNPGWFMHFIYEDVLYFTARDLGNVHQLWAHNQSNGTTWKIATSGVELDGVQTNPGQYMHHLVGDTLYFDANIAVIGRELIAYNFQNKTAWLVLDLAPGFDSSDPGMHMSYVMGDQLIFDTAGGNAWVHDTSNGSTWVIAGFTGGSLGENFTEVAIGDTFFFQANEGSSDSELWAYNTANGTVWMVADLENGYGGSSLGTNMVVVINDILYFDATTHDSGRELWAHDPYDGSTWLVVDISKGNASHTGPDLDSNPGSQFWLVHGGKLFFNAHDELHGSELWNMWFEHTVSYEA